MSEFFQKMRLFGKYKCKNQSPVPSKALHSLEEKLKVIDGSPLRSANSYTYDDIDANTFQEWHDFALEVSNSHKPQDSDKLRNALYYGFQPIFDLLVSDNPHSLGEKRKTALSFLDKIISLSRKYLHGYYSGNPNIKDTHQDLASLALDVTTLANIPYTTKSRNIDRNSIYPRDIHYFLIHYIRAVLDNKFIYPQCVVGSACGSSEIVLALAEVFDIPVGFMRMSERRKDKSIKIIEEYHARFQETICERHVVCVEDYVCTGRSLQVVMDKVKTYDPAALIGVALRNSQMGDCLQPITQEKGFHTFTLR